MNEYLDHPVQEIWQGQPLEGIKMSTAEIRKRAGKFENQVQWRNVREYLGALIAAVAWGFVLLKGHEILFRVAFGLFIAGLAYVVFQVHRKGSARSLPAAMGSASCLDFYRGQLERQRDLVSSVWWWYLAPLVPGFAVYTVAYALANPRWGNLGGLAVMNLIVAAVFFFIWKLNLRAARTLQRLIDDLSAAENSR
jgi:hypothetical protein